MSGEYFKPIDGESNLNESIEYLNEVITLSRLGYTSLKSEFIDTFNKLRSLQSTIYTSTRQTSMCTIIDKINLDDVAPYMKGIFYAGHPTNYNVGGQVLYTGDIISRYYADDNEDEFDADEVPEINGIVLGVCDNFENSGILIVFGNRIHELPLNPTNPKVEEIFNDGKYQLIDYFHNIKDSKVVSSNSESTFIGLMATITKKEGVNLDDT